MNYVLFGVVNPDTGHGFVVGVYSYHAQAKAAVRSAQSQYRAEYFTLTRYSRISGQRDTEFIETFGEELVPQG